MIDTMPAKAGKQKKSALKDWFESILFAVVVATLFRWLLFEQFIIPTPSMEGTMLVGDVIVVSKLHYGTRTLATPIQFPLTHQTFWGTEIPSYLDWIQLPTFRLPGFRKIKRMEPVVFNYPYEDQHPKDLKAHWVKRCVGLPGDSLKVIDGLLLVNDSVMPLPPQLQSSFFIGAKGELKDRFFETNGISEHQQVNGGYYVQTAPRIVEKLRSLPFINQVTEVPMDYSFNDTSSFPNGSPHGWSTDNFGPVWVPKKGDVISINDLTLPVYAGIITRFEGWENAEVIDRKLYINGYETTTYAFQQDYFFMMGDNRHNSEDSRAWGFVPEDHVVGKPVMVLFSSKDGPWYTLPGRVRWSRLFKLIDE